jgi:hypothetical protein
MEYASGSGLGTASEYSAFRKQKAPANCRIGWGQSCRCKRIVPQRDFATRIQTESLAAVNELLLHPLVRAAQLDDE